MGGDHSSDRPRHRIHQETRWISSARLSTVADPVLKRLARVFWPALNPGAWAVLVATVSFFRDDDLDALDVPHLLALCFYPWLSGLLWVILSAVLGSLSLVYLFSATYLH